MEYILQIHINKHNDVKNMYNCHLAPPGLQVTMAKQQVLYRLYTMVYFFRFIQLNKSVTEQTLQKLPIWNTSTDYILISTDRQTLYKYMHTNTWVNLHKYVCINIHEKTCTVKLHGHIITAQCSVLFIQNTTSHFHGMEYKFSNFLNRIVWHQIYDYIIKV